MTPEQFDILFERYGTGRLTPEEGDTLRACLSDPAWQRRWRDLSDLDGMLAGEFRVAAPEALPVPLPGDAARRSASISHRSLARATRVRRAARSLAPAGPVWLVAAAAVLLVGIALWRSGGHAPPVPSPGPAAGARPEAGAGATRKIDRLAAEQWLLRERLDSLEREREHAAARAALPRPPDAPGAAAPERDLARIETDRKAVEQEMARTVEAMRKIRAGAPEAARPAPPPATETGRPPGAVPPAADTAAALASIGNVEGVVWLESPPGERSAARAGAPVFAGSGIATAGAKGRATVVYPDRTRVELGGETRVACIAEAPPAATGAGKRIHLAAGTLAVDAARQPKDRALVVATPHAEATVQGTRFTIAADATRTQLQVEVGEVRLGNAHGAVPVRAGQASSATATAAPSAPAPFRPAAPAAIRVIDDFGGPFAWGPVQSMPMGCEAVDAAALGARRAMRLTYTPRENGKEYGFVIRPVELRLSDRIVRLRVLVDPGVRPPRDAILAVHLKERDGDVWGLDSQNKPLRDLGPAWHTLDFELPASEKDVRRTETRGDGRLTLPGVDALLVGIWGQQEGLVVLYLGDVAVVGGVAAR